MAANSEDVSIVYRWGNLVVRVVNYTDTGPGAAIESTTNGWERNFRPVRDFWGRKKTLRELAEMAVAELKEMRTVAEDIRAREAEAEKL